MTEINTLARLAYDSGRDPIDYAAMLIAFDLDVRDAVAAGQVRPGHAITLMEQTDDAYARRIIAKLLDAGWKPPVASAARPAEGAS